MGLQKVVVVLQMSKRLSFPPLFLKKYPSNSHISFQKDIKAVDSYVGISRVCFFKGGGTNVPKSVVALRFSVKADDVGGNREKFRWNVLNRTSSYVHMDNRAVSDSIP